LYHLPFLLLSLHLFFFNEKVEEGKGKERKGKERY
jgi:hypothetical protein